jgi:hypothetical protein
MHGSGYGPVASCFECGDEPPGSCATEFVSYQMRMKLRTGMWCLIERRGRVVNTPDSYSGGPGFKFRP